jgi:Beta-lactamase class C and other penicillin binding proteins
MAEWRKGAVDTSPAKARYDESRLSLMREHYAARIDSGKIQAASFLLARDGEVFAHEAAGKLSYKPEDDRPFMPDSIKRIASITKIVTATAVMKLVEDGKIWLEQPVKDFIPEFDTPLHGKINFRHLLTHTSGIVADPGYFAEPYPVDRRGELDTADWLKQVALAGPLQGEPGKQWSYSSTGFTLLSELVSRASGMHFNQFVQDRIFSPMGMTRSFLEPPRSLWPEISIMTDWEEERLSHAADRKGPPSGGGGVYSSLRDLFVLGQAFMDGGEFKGARLLGKKAAQEMTRDQLAGVPAFHWGKRLEDFRHGLGWGFYCDGSITGPATYNHQGWGCSYLFVDPVERFVLALFVVDPHDWNPELVVEPVNVAFSGIL